MPQDRVYTVTDEVAAAHAAVDLAAPGDLVVVLVDRVTLVWEALARRAEEASRPAAGSNGHLRGNGFSAPEIPLLSTAAPAHASRKHSATA
jgi:hypothetical protein